MTTPREISFTNLVNMFHGQCRSANMWIEQFTKNKDACGVRNAALAIGKVAGIYNVMIFMIQGDENLPEEIISKMATYMAIWDDIQKVPLRTE